MKVKNKQLMLSVIGIMIVIVGLVGLTYAFFNYTRTGNTNTIRVGRISFETGQTETISLTNLFPIDPDENGIMDDSTKVGTIEIEIKGDTDYNDGVEYLISATNTNIYAGGKVVPISIDIDINDLGVNNDSYFSARNSKNATIYKKMSGNEIAGNQSLLVGFIKPNTTSGQVEGVDGSVTIKAYLDKNKIAVSDTYNGMESDNMGTISEWVGDRTVFTTEEWNNLQSNGLSFQIKVEANEGIWVDEPIYNTLRTNAVMDNIASTNVLLSTGIDFSKISGDTDSDGIIDNGEGLYVRGGTENNAYPIIYYRGNVTNNNVFFANKCWQIIRTTETGGTKLIYNGENTGSIEEPACANVTGASRQITLNVGGNSVNTFAYSGSGLSGSMVYGGYMYKSPVNNSVVNGDYAVGSKFGNGIVWDGENYTITGISDSIDATHHYTCGTANAITCNSIRFYIAYLSVGNTNYHNYFTLTNGKKIDDIIEELLENGNMESNAKVMIDQWYEENLDNTVSEEKIEDTVYCNDRSIYQLGNLNPNGEDLTTISSSTFFKFSAYKRLFIDIKPNVKCLRVEDSFTKSNSIGNGLLDYPVGLITADEMIMAGGKQGAANSNYYLRTGSTYWSMSPDYFASSAFVYQSAFRNTGSLDVGTPDRASGLRPVISLRPESSIIDGDGTTGNPYIIK